MIRRPEEGWASSAAVYECSWLPNRWQWSASGPNGMTTGGAATEKEAWEQARKAQAALNKTMRPRGFG